MSKMVRTQDNANILLLGFLIRGSAKQRKHGRTVFRKENGISAFFLYV